MEAMTTKSFEKKLNETLNKIKKFNSGAKENIYAGSKTMYVVTEEMTDKEGEVLKSTKGVSESLDKAISSMKWSCEFMRESMMKNAYNVWGCADAIWIDGNDGDMFKWYKITIDILFVL